MLGMPNAMMSRNWPSLELEDISCTGRARLP
jgi:hypothetical protein